MRPAQSSKGPQPGREPRIQHVRVLLKTVGFKVLEKGLKDKEEELREAQKVNVTQKNHIEELEREFTQKDNLIREKDKKIAAFLEEYKQKAPLKQSEQISSKEQPPPQEQPPLQLKSDQQAESRPEPSTGLAQKKREEEDISTEVPPPQKSSREALAAAGPEQISSQISPATIPKNEEAVTEEIPKSEDERPSTASENQTSPLNHEKHSSQATSPESFSPDPQTTQLTPGNTADPKEPPSEEDPDQPLPKLRKVEENPNQNQTSP